MFYYQMEDVPVVEGELLYFTNVSMLFLFYPHLSQTNSDLSYLIFAVDLSFLLVISSKL